MNAPESLPLRLQPRWHQPGLLQGLGDAFFTALPPQALPEVHWVARSDALAHSLGLAGWLDTPEALALLGGNAVPGPGGPQPLASVYSGHQFGVWAGQLGDGRALLLGELDTPAGPQELQLKGSGRTPYSRMGDGRAVLRSSIREFLCSEAMHALGIPTTRALAVLGSPAPVRRETVETAAVVARVAPSFLRFGHLEHFAHTAQDVPALQRLVDVVIARFYPEAASAPQPAAALLQAVAERTAWLVAQWQQVGFCHGVMNTDNMSLLGLTIDYGPFGFLDAFDPGHICNHSDERGRYAFARQPSVAFWNLHALAQALLPVVAGDQDLLLAALEPYKAVYEHSMHSGMRAKLGLATEQAGDPALIDSVVQLLAAQRCDWTIFWRRLCQFDSRDTAPNAPLRDLFMDRDAFDAWAVGYRTRLQAERSVDTARATRMQRHNPRVVLRNHLAELAIRAAQQGNFEPTQALLKVLQQPYDTPARPDGLDDFPPDWAGRLEVSCSS